MGNQSLHSSSTSCWLSICHARKMNAERLSLFLCFHSLLRLNWSGPLPLIDSGVFTQVREQWEGPSISTRTAIPSALCLCANVEGVLQSPIYNSLIFKEWDCFFNHLFIYRFISQEFAHHSGSAAYGAREGIKPSEFSWKNNQPSCAIKTTKARVMSTRPPLQHY